MDDVTADGDVEDDGDMSLEERFTGIRCTIEDVDDDGVIVVESLELGLEFKNG